VAAITVTMVIMDHRSAPMATTRIPRTLAPLTVIGDLIIS
jgi:hypothetical protein